MTTEQQSFVGRFRCDVAGVRPYPSVYIVILLLSSFSRALNANRETGPAVVAEFELLSDEEANKTGLVAVKSNVTVDSLGPSSSGRGRVGEAIEENEIQGRSVGLSAFFVCGIFLNASSLFGISLSRSNFVQRLRSGDHGWFAIHEAGVAWRLS